MLKTARQWPGILVFVEAIIAVSKNVEDKVTGKAKYSGNLSFSMMLYGTGLRSLLPYTGWGKHSKAFGVIEFVSFNPKSDKTEAYIMLCAEIETQQYEQNSCRRKLS